MVYVIDYKGRINRPNKDALNPRLAKMLSIPNSKIPTITGASGVAKKMHAEVKSACAVQSVLYLATQQPKFLKRC